MKKSLRPDDYKSKLFGLAVPSLAPWYFQSLKLKYALKALRKMSAKGKVLEIGCGGGGMAKAIKNHRPDLSVFGCDISQKSLNFARQESQGVSFVRGDAYCLPFEKNYFEAVVMFDTLEHFKWPRKALKEIKRVLKKGGVFHSATPLEGEPLTLHGFLRLLGWRVKEKSCGHFKMYRFGEPEKLMKKAGFEVVKTVYSGHFLYQLVDALYFSLLGLSGKKVSFQVEGYLERSPAGPGKNLLKALKNLIASACFLESSLLFFIPGGFGHQTAIKNGFLDDKIQFKEKK